MRWKVIVFTLKPDIKFWGNGCVYKRFDYDFKAYEFILTHHSTNPNPTAKAASMRTQGTVWH